MTTKIIVSLAVIAAVAAGAAGVTRALYNTTVTASGSQVSTASMDLFVDSDPSSGTQTWSHGFTSPIVLNTLKPGFSTTQIVDIKNEGTVDGNASIRFVLTSNKENGLLAPEIAVGDNEAGDGNWNGELAQNMRVKISYASDNTNFGSVLYDNTLTEFNANPNQLALGSLLGNHVGSVKIEYSIPSDAGNNIMSDSLTVDTIFGLTQTN